MYVVAEYHVLLEHSQLMETADRDVVTTRMVVHLPLLMLGYAERMIVHVLQIVDLRT
jgi:hypothetical protein